jgi:divalent metal cation (Fe/Co/Zn/Cd) transporter
MDGIESELVDRAQAALAATPGVLAVPRLQLRWVGHRLQGAEVVKVADAALSNVEEVVHEAEHRLAKALPNLDDMTIRAVTTDTVSVPHPH